jgi:predicted nucleotidyltransferase
MPARTTVEATTTWLTADGVAVTEMVARAAPRGAVVLLLGSRALGNAEVTSDVDLAVVVPTWRLPATVRRIGPVRDELERRLGVPVSVNPIPRFRLTRAPGSLYLLKVRREAIILSAPLRFALRPVERPTVSPFAAASYVLSAALAVVEAVDPARCALDGDAMLAHAIRKAVLEVAQLRLLDRARYASTLDEALEELDDDELRALARSAEAPSAIGRVRDLLLCEARRRPLRVRWWKMPVRNVQYALLAALRGRSRWRTALSLEAVEVRLARTLVRLLASVPTIPQGDGATGAEERWSDWLEARAWVSTEWRDAHPLTGLLG